MKLHYLQHVPFEGPANLETWAEQKNFTISLTRFFKGERPPGTNSFDWLIVMGGPMNVYEENLYPWLVQEKKFIEASIREGKIVLGICLGAQLISDVLGGRVYKNSQKEIGWYPVSLTREGRESPVFSALPLDFMAFHWHGDTFDLPDGAARLAESEATAAQAFEYDDGRVIGLQFHLESTLRSVRLLCRNCGHELTEGKFIQTQDQILSGARYAQDLDRSLNLLLNRLKDVCGITGANSPAGRLAAREIRG